jgi:hypothetical protein
LFSGLLSLDMTVPGRIVSAAHDIRTLGGRPGMPLPRHRAASNQIQAKGHGPSARKLDFQVRRLSEGQSDYRAAF